LSITNREHLSINLGDHTHQSPSTDKLPKKESSMTCCEDARIESKAPISLGKGSLLVRVKALGNSGWRASAKKSAELMRSVS